MITDLKDHFARDATNDIESVFLISKSNCAFVNYKTEAACAAAMTRFHDSKFQSVRLVCRLRRNSANPAASSGAAASRSSSLSITAPGSFAEEAKASKDDIPKSRLPVDVQLADGIVPKSKVTQSEGERTAVRNKERFFILKSLTVDDLELSARSGIWATQAHNEESLNKAYESSESVYLIFSANKSGEYFGYARMLSPINDETASSIQWAPTSSSIMFTEAQDVPKAISTPATACAPAGRIIDDSARGTIFWEADSEDLDQAVAGHVNKDGNVEEEGEAIGDKSDAEGDYDGTPGDQSSLDTKVWGKPFRVQWISTNRLPFYRTRGLRNALNVNREVKIARDGTELETVVGKKLIQMFQRPPPSSVSPAGSEHGPPDGQASFGAHPQGQLGAQHHY
ncbi:MAG: hypothetical protein M1829_006426 [Trizodia sp. TS-e1964]|nr:MAG: hypothetical protein M1829_006426 [Trizodia sp. TS-e1964]